MHRSRLAAAALVALASTASVSLAQVTKTWVGGDPIGNFFDVGGNWSPSGAPGPLDTAVFNAPSKVVAWDGFTGDTTNARLEVLAGGTTFSIVSGGPRTHTVTDLFLSTGLLQLNPGMTLNVTSTNFVDFVSGVRLNVNTGAAFNAPNADLDFGFDGTTVRSTLSVFNGVVNSRGANLGYSPTLSGRALIDGSIAFWNMTEDLRVGRSGTGILIVSNGARVSNRDGFLGTSEGSEGTAEITGNGSGWTNTGNLALGRSGGGSTGNLTIGAGGRLNVGDTAASNTVGGFSFIEDESTDPTDGGVLSVYAGSTLTNTANTGLSIGRGVGRRGSVLVSGAGATINDNATYLGFQGNGTLTINAGGDYIANAAFFATSGGTATVTVDGANSLLWSKGNLDLGSTTFGGAGTITTTNGGTVLIGDVGDPFGDGSLIVSDSNPAAANAGGKLSIANGSVLNHHFDVVLAPSANTHASVLVTGTNSAFVVAGVFFLGNSGGGVADVRVENGGKLSASGTYENPGGNSGTYTTSVSGTGSRLEAGNVFISSTGAGTSNQFTVSAGGRAQTVFQFVADGGPGATCFATVNGTNSTIAVGTTLEVGRGGTGTLNIQSAGKVTAANAVVGNLATGVGTIDLTGTGSLLDVEGDLTVGNLGRGTVNLGTGSVIAVGDAAPTGSSLRVLDSNLAGNAGGNLIIRNSSTMTVDAPVLVASLQNTYGRIAIDGVGSTFTTTAGMDVGVDGNGTLEVTGGARFTLSNPSNGDLTLGDFAGIGTGIATVDGTTSILSVEKDVRIRRSSNLIVRNGGRLLVGDRAFGPSLLTGPEGAPLVQVDISDDDRDGFRGGRIDILPGSLLSADNDVAIASEFSSYGRVDVDGVSGTTPARMTVGTDLIVARGFTASSEPSPEGVLIVNSVGILSITNGGRVTVGQSMLIASDSNANGTVTVTGRTGTVGSTLDVTNDLRVGPAGVGDNVFGSLIIADGGTVSAGELAINTFNSNVRIDAGGTLLIDSNFFNPSDQVREYLVVGYNSGNWANVGITSLTATGNSSLGVGYVNDGTILTVKLTLKGDADLNGTVAFPDLLSLAQNYGQSGRYWQQGDFDYNGAVEFPDLLALAQNYNSALLGSSADFVGPGASFQADWAMARSLVPEPTTLMAVTALMVLTTRRR